MVAVGIGLALLSQSLPLAGVAIGKFDREVDQSSGSGGFLLLKFGCLTWFHYGVYPDGRYIYPDKPHSETKSKFSKHPNFKLKCRLNRCSVRLRDRTFLWRPR